MRWGVRPDKMPGHRWGRVAAACACGSITIENGIRLAEWFADTGSTASGEHRPGAAPAGNLLENMSVKAPACTLSSISEDDVSAHDERWYRDFDRQTGTVDGRPLLTGRETQEFVLIEIGSRQRILSALTALDPDACLSSIPFFMEKGTPRNFVQQLLADLYRVGVDIVWPSVYQYKEKTRVPLPTYPFQKKRFWKRSAS